MNFLIPCFKEGEIKRIGTNNPCVICNREVRKPTKNFVHIVNGGSHFASYNLPEKDIRDSLGLLPIGPECKNKLPKDFIFRSF